MLARNYVCYDVIEELSIEILGDERGDVWCPE